MKIEGRRALQFSGLGEVMPEVDRLLLGHEAVGQWTLGQICNHLTSSIAGAVDGYPYRAPWLVRKSIGPLIVRRINKTGRFPTGIRSPEKLRPRPGLDARAEAEALRAAIRLFQGHPGPFADHPFGGPIGQAAWGRFATIHAAHHLSFVRPSNIEVA